MDVEYRHQGSGGTMNQPDHAALAAEILRRRVTATRQSGISRDEGVSIIAQALTERKRHKTVSLRRSWGIASAAALFAVVGWAGQGFVRATHPSNRATTANCSVAQGCNEAATPTSDRGTVEGRTVEPGAHIAAAKEHATDLDLASGTRLSLAPGSQLSYDEGSSTHRFSLTRGSVHLEVKKLVAQQRFLVTTADAEVEVRGTVFDVSWQPTPDACGIQTHVQVSEGVVEVRHGKSIARVTAGEAWPPACASPLPRAVTPSVPTRRVRASDPVPVGAALPTMDGATAKDKAAASVPMPVETKRASDLAEQNDLFARANTQRQSGKSVQAIQLYDALLERFPRSPLAESAQSARLALLKSTDPPRARREAERYLRSYPSGFSRHLAEGILGER